MSDFSDRPFVAGSLVGLRAFDVDKLGRLVGPSYPQVFKPGENDAECRKNQGVLSGLFSATFTTTGISEYERALYRSMGIMPPQREPQPKPAEAPPHTLGGVQCTCGFYAYFDGGNDYKQPGRISAVIEGYGVCTVGGRGFRASKARLLAIAPGGHYDATKRALLERNYPDVPFYDTWTEAVAAHPLTQEAMPTPADDDFWTRSAS